MIFKYYTYILALLFSVILTGCASNKNLLPINSKLVTTNEAFTGQFGPNQSNNLRMHVLNVGNGNCILLEAPNDAHILLVDCGSSSNCSGQVKLATA